MFWEVLSHSNIAVFKDLATANENESQVTCYPTHGDWLFVTYYILKSIDHTISVQNLVLNRNPLAVYWFYNIIIPLPLTSEW